MTNPQKKTVLSYATKAVELSETVAKLHTEVEALSSDVHLDSFSKCSEMNEEEARLLDGAADRLRQAENALLEINSFLCAAIGRSIPKEDQPERAATVSAVPKKKGTSAQG